jgi:hypothetical protein
LPVLKKRSKILSRVNLALFIISLTLASAISYANARQAAADNLKHIALSPRNNADSECSTLAIVNNENETETENDFHTQAFSLSLLVYFLPLPAETSVISSYPPIAETLSNHIYIRTCNFRI